MLNVFKYKCLQEQTVSTNNNSIAHAGINLQLTKEMTAVVSDDNHRDK